MQTISDQRFISMKEAQQRLGVSRQTIYRWAWNNTLPTVKVGAKLRLVPVAALEAMVASAEGGERAASEGGRQLMTI